MTDAEEEDREGGRFNGAVVVLLVVVGGPELQETHMTPTGGKWRERRTHREGEQKKY